MKNFEEHFEFIPNNEKKYLIFVDKELNEFFVKRNSENKIIISNDKIFNSFDYFSEFLDYLKENNIYYLEIGIFK